MLRSLTHEAARTLIQAFISSRLDYCNSLLYGVSENLIRAERRCSASHWSRTMRPYLAGFAAVALAASSETRWLQTSMFCLLVFVWPRTSRTSVPRRRHTSGLQRSSTAATLFHWQILCHSMHTQVTHSATGASLSPGHVFGTVFWPTCATRTLHMAVSGVNSKCFVLTFNVASGVQWDFC